MEMVSVEQLVSEKRAYRKLKKLLDFERIAKAVKIKSNEFGAVGYGKLRLIVWLDSPVYGGLV